MGKFAKSYMPQMRFALYGWMASITLVIKGLVKIDNDGEATFPDQKSITFDGVIMPEKPTSLEIKSYQQKSFLKYTIFTFTQNGLVGGDRVLYEGKSFKVIDLSDYSLNNYYNYNLIEDFEED